MKKIIVVYPSFLAGMGPSTWLSGTLEIVRLFAWQNDIQFEYIGPKLNVSGIDIIPNRELVRVSSVEENYLQLERLLRGSLDGVEEIAIVSVGYTSYTSWAVKRVLRENQKANLLIVDSSPPDTDFQSSETNESGIPTSRFYWPAYNNENYLKQHLYLFSTYQFSSNLVLDRVPLGMSSVLIGQHPYPYGTEKQLQFTDSEKYSKVIIPIICAGDYWDVASVGKWMTVEQYESMKIGTSNLVKAICIVSSKLNQMIYIPIDERGLNFIKQYTTIPDNIVFQQFKNLSKQEHWSLMKSASVNITRGGNQTNAVVACTLMKAPFLFWNVPGYKYMQTWETNYEALKSGLMAGFDWDEDYEKIADNILSAINKKGEWKERPKRLLEAYQKTPTLFETLENIFGNLKEEESELGGILFH